MASRKGQGGTRAAKAAPVTKPAADVADQQVAATAPVELPTGIARYPVLSPLRFAGRLYGPDDPAADVVTMTEDQAGPLQPLGVLGDRLD